MHVSQFELSLGLVRYLKTLTPREQWKLCRMILLKLDARRMTMH